MKKDRVPGGIMMYKLAGHTRWSHEHCPTYEEALKKKYQTLADHEGAKAHAYNLNDSGQMSFDDLKEEDLGW